MVVGLFTPDRRYLGVLLVSTDTTDRPSDADRDLVGVLAPRIAAAVDPMRSLAVLARVVHDARAGAVLTRCGDVLGLPGLPGHALLAPGSALLGVALRQLVERAGSGSFLWPIQAGSGGCGDLGEFLRVTVLGCANAPPQVLGVVVLSPLPGGRSVLSQRELVVVGLLLEGWSEGRIAVAMDLPAGVVAEIAERVTARLGAPDRHSALVRAARQGWFIPPRCVGPAR
jgi:DNA-binding CsgD family transcriptional regulator